MDPPASKDTNMHHSKTSPDSDDLLNPITAPFSPPHPTPLPHQRPNSDPTPLSTSHPELNPAPAPAQPEPQPSPRAQGAQGPDDPEAAFERLRERKITQLRARNEALEGELEELRGRLVEVRGELREKDAAKTVRRHIHLLHEYNEMRDVGQGLLGMIADQRGVRIRELYGEFGVGVED